VVKADLPRRPRLLLTEDNALARKLILTLLDQLGYRADVASDGKEALAALRRGGYDLVLMDCEMPELDGFETIRQWRSEETGAPVPVIAITGHGGAADRERCFAAGMDDHLAKPFEPADLAAALDRWLGTTSVAPVLDPVPLEALRQLGERAGRDVVGHIVGLFLEQVPARLEALRQALASGDQRNVEQHAHWLANSADQVGARAASACARQMEDHARGQAEPVAWDQLDAAFAVTIAELRNLD